MKIFSIKPLIFPIILSIAVVGLGACTGMPTDAQKKEMAQGSAAHNARKAESLLNIARSSAAGGDPQTAANLYEQVITLQPQNATARMELVRLYQQNNADSPRVIALLHEAVQHAGNDIGLKQEIGLALLNAKSYGAAASTLKEVVEANPDAQPLVYNGWGISLDMLGRSEEAQQAYRAGLQRYPQQHSLACNYGLSYALAGDYDEAIRLLTPLVNSLESTPTARQNLALAYGLKGDEANAKKIASQDLTPEQLEENLRFYKRFIAGLAAVEGAPAKLSKAAARGDMQGPMMPAVMSAPTMLVKSQKAVMPATPKMYGPFLPGQALE